MERPTVTSPPVRETSPGAALASVGLELLLLAGAALIFALSFPSFLSRWGWFPLAFIALTPVFIVVHRAGWVRTVLYGAFFGFASYALYNYWLGSFHPLTLIIVPPIYSVYFLAVFPLLKAADSLFPRYGFILQALIWVAYEFAKVRHLYQAMLGIGDLCRIEWFVGPHTIHGKGTFDFLHEKLNWPKP